MPFCPSCRGEFREEITRCERCRQDLVRELPPDFLDPAVAAAHLEGRDLAVLCMAPLDALKQTRDGLASEGQACLIGPPPGQEPQAGRIAPRLALYVAAEELDGAKTLFESQIMQQLDSSQVKLPGAEAAATDDGEDGDDESDSCPACGDPLAAKAEQCEGCGLWVG